jgi:hypothetical protein
MVKKNSFLEFFKPKPKRNHPRPGSWDSAAAAQHQAKRISEDVKGKAIPSDDDELVIIDDEVRSLIREL